MQLVLDTNVVLDLLVFKDPRCSELDAGLREERVHWIATASMREELRRVLHYPHIAAVCAARALDSAGVLARFDACATLVQDPIGSSIRCTDADDQKFIDLAVAHRCALVSKDAAVLTLRRKLAAVDVAVSPAFSGGLPRTGPTAPSASTA